MIPTQPDYVTFRRPLPFSPKLPSTPRVTPIVEPKIASPESYEVKVTIPPIVSPTQTVNQIAQITTVPEKPIQIAGASEIRAVSPEPIPIRITTDIPLSAKILEDVATGKQRLPVNPKTKVAI